jgi:hypothetical protein
LQTFILFSKHFFFVLFFEISRSKQNSILGTLDTVNHPKARDWPSGSTFEPLNTKHRIRTSIVTFLKILLFIYFSGTFFLLPLTLTAQGFLLSLSLSLSLFPFVFEHKRKRQIIKKCFDFIAQQTIIIKHIPSKILMKANAYHANRTKQILKQYLMHLVSNVK